jgi:hypothetical protein
MHNHVYFAKFLARDATAWCPATQITHGERLYRDAHSHVIDIEPANRPRQGGVKNSATSTPESTQSLNAHGEKSECFSRFGKGPEAFLGPGTAPVLGILRRSGVTAIPPRLRFDAPTDTDPSSTVCCK